MKKSILIWTAIAGIVLLGIYYVHAGQLLFDGVPVDITTTANEDLVICPGSGGNTQIGDETGTNTNATSNDDLHVTGVIETDGVIYSDSGIISGSTIRSDSDSTDNLGSSSIAWLNLYVDTISTTSGTDLSLSPASGSGVDGSVTRFAATGAEVAYDLAATVNKATSGNYTGLKLNVTETSAPGTADKLLDLQIGGSSYFQVYNGLLTADYGLVSIGNAAWDGSTSGHFSGSSNGTQIAANTPSTFIGNLLDLQVNGSSVYSIDYQGNITTSGTGGGVTNAKYVVTEAHADLSAEILTTALSSNLIADEDSSRDLGSSTKAWTNLYVDSIKTVSGTNLTLVPTSAYTIIGDAGTAGHASANDDLFVSGALEVDGITYADGGVTSSGDLTLDDGTGDSPSLILQCAGDKTFTIVKTDAGQATLTNSEGAINLLPSNDADDYISISTSSSVPQIATVGDANLTMDILNTGANSTLTVTNSNSSYVANMSVEGQVAAEDLDSSDDADIKDNLTVGDIIVDEAAGVIEFSGATSNSILCDADILTLGGVNGAANNENLTLNFESTADSVVFGTGTGVTSLDFGSLNLKTTGKVGTKTIILKPHVETFPVTTGDGKIYFTVPAELNGMNLVRMSAHLYTAGSTNTTIQIYSSRHDPNDMLSAAATLGSTVKDASGTINTLYDNVATYDEIRVDVDAAGTGAKGLEVSLAFRLP